jgi:cytosine/adenosine deaminase-related metal-dependent hydrolase
MIETDFFWSPESAWGECRDFSTQDGLWLPSQNKTTTTHESRKLRLLLPGLINSHVHLELTDLGQKIPVRDFFGWILDLQSKVHAWTPDIWEQSWLQGAEILLAQGCTSLFDIGNSRTNFHSQSPQRIWRALEILGSHPHHASKIFEGAMGDLGTATQNPALLSAHSYHACSKELLELWYAETQKQAWIPCLHLAESEAERMWMEQGTGPFAPLLAERTGGLAQSPRSCSGRALWDVLPEFRGWVIHGNTLNAQELLRLKESGSLLVHCPQSHHFFLHPELNWEELERLAIPIALGTDSAASVEKLDLWCEMRRMRNKNWSWDKIFRSVTEVPAQWMRRDGLLGSLAENACADWCLLELDAFGLSAVATSLALDASVLRIQELLDCGAFRTLQVGIQGKVVWSAI